VVQNTEPAVHVRGQEPLTASMLAAAPLKEQKQLLGILHTWSIKHYLWRCEHFENSISSKWWL